MTIELSEKMNTIRTIGGKHPVNPSYLVLCSMFSWYVREVSFKRKVLGLMNGCYNDQHKMKAIMQTNGYLDEKTVKFMLDRNIEKAYNYLLSYRKVFDSKITFEEHRQNMIKHHEKW